MIRGITMIALGGAALSVLCFGAAASRGPVVLWSSDTVFSDTSSATTTRTLDWQGSNALTFNLPARIICKQGEHPGITLSGSEKLVDQVRLHDNTLDMGEGHIHSLHWRNSSLTITVTAPALNTLTLNGFGSLDMQDFQQPHLALTINGAATVTVHGRADSLTLALEGAGSANLTDLILSDLDLSMDGAGSVKAGPTGHVKISIDGAGSVKLLNTPQSLTQDIDGIGSVTTPHPGAHTAPNPSPQPDKGHTADKDKTAGEDEEDEASF